MQAVGLITVLAKLHLACKLLCLLANPDRLMRLNQLRLIPHCCCWQLRFIIAAALFGLFVKRWHFLGITAIVPGLFGSRSIRVIIKLIDRI